jgi:hypothetical protein
MTYTQLSCCHPSAGAMCLCTRKSSTALVATHLDKSFLPSKRKRCLHAFTVNSIGSLTYLAILVSTIGLWPECSVTLVKRENTDSVQLGGLISTSGRKNDT